MTKMTMMILTRPSASICKSFRIPAVAKVSSSDLIPQGEHDGLRLCQHNGLPHHPWPDVPQRAPRHAVLGS